MALKEFLLPDIGEGIAEGEIVSWKVHKGQQVKEEDEFVEVMTDKATVMITVPFDGVIAELAIEVGLLGVHEESGEQIKRYRVPDIYRHALQMKRRGPV